MAAAVHEAGHAIVAWVLGLKVEELRIGENGKGASLIEHDTHLQITHGYPGRAISRRAVAVRMEAISDSRPTAAD